MSDNFKIGKANEKRNKGLKLVDSSYLDLLNKRLYSKRLYDKWDIFKKVNKEIVIQFTKKSLQRLKSTKKDVSRLLAKMQKSIEKIQRMEKQNTKHVQKKFNRLKKEFK